MQTDGVRPSFHDFSHAIPPTAPKAKGTAGCLIVWKKAVLFAQKLYIQSSLIGALARGPCSNKPSFFLV
jgi:hypothetical protein